MFVCLCPLLDSRNIHSGCMNSRHSDNALRNYFNFAMISVISRLRGGGFFLGGMGRNHRLTCMMRCYSIPVACANIIIPTLPR